MKKGEKTGGKINETTIGIAKNEAEALIMSVTSTYGFTWRISKTMLMEAQQ
ncbi:MAG: hypothetical protein NC308_09105 [Clostridium sp.]|nr:hypothetical protein [Bacteroides sp.]MCM1199033.1 hypothetical protein [Clostridium sp.]